MGLFNRFKRPENGGGETSEIPNVEALIGQGNAFEDRGQLEQALAAYDSAICLMPTMARAHLNRGNVLLKKGDGGGALAAYAAALAGDPGYAAAHFNTGNAYLELGRHDVAAHAYRQALALNPAFPEAELALQHVLRQLGSASELRDVLQQLGAAPESDGSLLKLHVGGKKTKPGWKILNALSFDGVDFVGDVRNLEAFADESCAIVYASHVMEHIGQRDFVDTLKGIRRILCQGGQLYFSAPDLETLCRLFLDPSLDSMDRYYVMRMMFGGQADDYDFHYIGLSEEFMLDFFKRAGFSGAQRVQSLGLFNDTSSHEPYGAAISLNMIAVK